MVRYEDDLAIGRVVVQREGRDDVDFVTNREAAHILADSVDGACGLIAETCRKLDGLDVVVDAPHGFGAVDSDRLDLDADLVRTWGRNPDLDERENLRSSSLCEFDRARHGGLRYVEPGLGDSACAEAAGCFWLQPATRRQVPRLENRCSHARRLPRNRAHGANPRRELQ